MDGPLTDVWFVVQLFVVDRVDIGLLNVTDAEGRRRLNGTLSQLSEAIQQGLTGTVGDFHFGVTSLRQCDYGDGINNGCNYGTVLATSSSPVNAASFNGDLGAINCTIYWLLAAMALQNYYT